MSMEIGAILNDDLAAWFDWDDGTELRIGYLTTEVADECLRRCTKTKRGKETIDNVKLQVEFARHCLLGWKGFLKDGEPLSFNDENRDRVIKKFSGLAGFISDKTTDHSEIIRAQQEEKRKNSSSTLGPEQPTQV